MIWTKRTLIAPIPFLPLGDVDDHAVSVTEPHEPRPFESDAQLEQIAREFVEPAAKL